MPTEIDPYLTPRRCEILRHLLRGRLVKQIAADLRVKHGTVQESIDDIRRHFGAETRAHLLAILAQRGILDRLLDGGGGYLTP